MTKSDADEYAFTHPESVITLMEKVAKSLKSVVDWVDPGNTNAGFDVDDVKSSLESVDSFLSFLRDLVEEESSTESELDDWKVGTITDINAPSGSGGITVEIDGVSYFGDNGPTIRALDAIFEDVISAGHSFDSTRVIGKQVRYLSSDDTFARELLALDCADEDEDV